MGRLDEIARSILADRYASRASVSGWLYTARFESAFIDGELTTRPVERRLRIVRQGSEPGDPRHAAGAHLDRIARLPGAEAHAALLELAEQDLPSLTLGTDGWGDGGLRVLVIGAGPVGLGLASALKVVLGDRVDVLVVERRVTEPGRKLPYARRWLTAVSLDIVEGLVEDRVLGILGRVGDGRHVGVTIHLLETLLLLSCRRMGVRFRFDAAPDLALAAEADLVFDATGNRFAPPSEPAGPRPWRAIPTSELKGFSEEILTSYGVDVRAQREGVVEIAADGDLRVPLVAGRRMRQAMLKVIGVPVRLCDALVERVRPKNGDNKHYVWRGTLRPEINEALLIVNLTRAEHEAMGGRTYPLALDEARGLLDERTDALLGFLVEQATPAERARMTIDAPFLWSPYLVERTEPERLHGRPVVRVGDSLYNGSVKLANGLGPHLSYLKHVQRMVWAHATAERADEIARAFGAMR